MIADEPRTSIKERLLLGAVVAAATGLFFILVYGQTNAHAAHLVRSGAVLPTVAFEWERHIPIVPAFIIPYMSIDLFFVASAFLCPTRRQLSRHAMRLLLAIAVAGVFFWFVPLEYAFPRPKVGGIFGPIFDFLHGFDQPHNLAPSLHIALRSLLWVVYVRETTGPLRGGIKVWFIAIGLSTLLVGQHHVVDIITGQMLAMWCLHLIPDQRTPALPALTNRRVGSLYLLAAIVCAGLGANLGWWGLLFAWPAYASLIVAGAYFGAGPGVFRKFEGRLNRSSVWILGPYLFSAWLNWRLTRSRDPMNRVTPTLLVGRRLGGDEVEAVERMHVIDLTAEFSSAARKGSYVQIPVVDLVVPSIEQLRAVAREYLARRRSGEVLVCCGLGYSRSACAAAACLIASGECANVTEAAGAIAAVRRVELSKRHRDALEAFAREGANV